jgi:flagellar motor switch protein FliG
MAKAAETAITGSQRAAILLLTLGEQDAAEVLKHLSARDVQAVGTAMAALSGVSREQVEVVLEKLTQDMGQQTALGVGTEEYIRKILVNALGESKAGGLLDRILLGRSKPNATSSASNTPKPCLTRSSTPGRCHNGTSGKASTAGPRWND